MRKLLYTFIAFIAISFGAIQAQPITSYGFQCSQGSYNEISGGTTMTLAEVNSNVNDVVFIGSTTGTTEKTTAAGFPIGFDFVYNNTTMNKFAIGMAGYIMLGKDEITIDPEKSPVMFLEMGEGKHNVIGMGVANSSVMSVSENTEVSYKVLGNSPDRILAVQFKKMNLKNTWENPFCEFDFQIRLYESENRIEFVFNNWGKVTLDIDLMTRLGIKGTGDDSHLRCSSANDFSNTEKFTNELRNDFVRWSSENYPADGLVYTFTPSADCTVPSAQPTDLVLSSKTIQVEGSFTLDESTDRYLVVMTNEPTLTQLPTDQTNYSPGDIIGNGKVIAFSTEDKFSTPDDLIGSTTYYFHIFAANTYCTYGPKINTTNPLIGQITTLPAAPASLEIKDVQYEDVVIGAEANIDWNQVIIAVTDEPSLSQYQQIQALGLFGTPSEELNVGDEIEGGGKVVYKGGSNENINVADLENGTVYHFRAWSFNSDIEYSTVTLDKYAVTSAKVPYYPPFDKMPIADTPLGWEREGDLFRLNNARQLECNVQTGNPTEGMLNSITSPWILLATGENRVLFSANYTVFGRPSTPYNDWDERDVLEIQASKDGETFITVYEINKENVPQLTNVNSMAKFSLPFEEMNGERVKVRIRWNTYAPTAKLLIQDFLVEEKPECEYFLNVKVDEESIIGTKALISWDSEEVGLWEVRYRVSGAEEWSEPFEVAENPYLCTNLPEATTIDLQVRVKCSLNRFSEWSNLVKFTTGYNVPLSEGFDDNKLPARWSFENGLMAEETSFCTGFPCGKNWSIRDNKAVVNYSISLKDWLLLPLVDLGSGDVNYVLEFDLFRELTGETLIEDTDSLVLVASTNNGKTFGFDGVMKVWKGSDGSFGAIQEEGSHFTVDLNGYTGVVRFAFYAYSEGNRKEMVSIDNISILYSCPPAENTVVENIEADGAVVTWEGEADEWLVFVRKAGDEERDFKKQTEKTIILEELDQRTSYEVGITKMCSEDDMAKVIIASFMTLSLDPCLAPTDITVVPVQNSATISWDGDALSYNIRFRLSGEEEWIDRTSNTTEINIAGLDPETEYEYEIQSVCNPDNDDYSEWTETATFTTLKVTCFTPASISIVPAHRTAVVTWEGDASSYELIYREEGETDWTTIADINAQTKEIEGLTILTNYQLRLRSICGDDDVSLWSGTLTFKTKDLPPCGIPTNLRVEGITDNSATILWDADETNLSWDIRYRVGTETSWETVSGLTEKTYTINDLNPNTIYLWAVMATCENGQSSWAVENQFTTEGLPSSLDGTHSGSFEVFLSKNILNVLNPEQEFIESINIYNLNGALLQHYDINASENVLISLANPAQIMIIEVKGRDFRDTYKVVLK